MLKIRSDSVKTVQMRLQNFSDRMLDKTLLHEIGDFAMFNIKRLTGKGLDYRGNRFIPYTPAYAVFRKKKGHDVSKVNLFFHGHMMNSMTRKASGKNMVEIFFANPLQAAKAHGLNTTRRFFAVDDRGSSDTMKRVRDIISSFFKRRGRDLGLQ